MDKADIKTFRHWHKRAALLARDAGFDVVYVYATHGYLLSNFLNPRINTRSDEYGGSLENRIRLKRELIEETKDAVGDRSAVAVRFSSDEEIGEDGNPIFGERREMFVLLSDLPDLWDINIADYSLKMGVSRFVKEAPLEPLLNWVKSVADKPVVTVGRLTSPDTMASQVKREITDFIGAARYERMHPPARLSRATADRDAQFRDFPRNPAFGARCCGRRSRTCGDRDRGQVAQELFNEERHLLIAEGDAAARVFTPDDIMEDTLPDGPTTLFDGSGYYVGGSSPNGCVQRGMK